MLSKILVMHLQILYFCICNFVSVLPELITLTKNNKIKCVSVGSPNDVEVYVVSRNATFTVQPQFKEISLNWDLTNSNWTLENYSYTSKFEINEIIFLDASFKEKCELTIYNETNGFSPQYWQRHTLNTSVCNQFILRPKNKEIEISSYCTEYNKEIVTDEVDYFFKNYSLLANVYTEYYHSYHSGAIYVDQDSHINVTSLDCVSMLVYVRKNCSVLEILLDGVKKDTISSNRNFIKINTATARNLTLRRRVLHKNNNFEECKNESPYWTIGRIEDCTSGKDVPFEYRVYTTTFNVPDDAVCKTRYKVNNNSQNFWNKSNTICEAVLGPSYPRCEKHKICEDTKCWSAEEFKEPNSQTTSNPSFSTTEQTTFSTSSSQEGSSTITFKTTPVHKSLQPPDIKINACGINVKYNKSELELLDREYSITYRCISNQCESKNLNFKKFTLNRTMPSYHISETLEKYCEYEVNITMIQETEETNLTYLLKTETCALDIVKDVHFDGCGIDVEFRKFKDFIGSFTYFITYTCIDKCINNNTNSINLTLNNNYITSYHIPEKVQIDSTYEVNILINRAEETSKFSKLLKSHIGCENETIKYSTNPNIIYTGMATFAFILIILLLLIAYVIKLKYKWVNTYQNLQLLDKTEESNIEPRHSFVDADNFHRFETFELPENSNSGVTKIETTCLENYLIESLLQTDKLKVQFRLLPEKTLEPNGAAFVSKNKNKNKDKENVPYDFNRVKLLPLEGVGVHDYINASYIDGFERKKAYIATQGPKYYTVRDFWRMIWQEKVETIVMATNFLENKNRKCAEYFPLACGAIFECGKIFIELINEEKYEHHHVRYLIIHYKSYKRYIKHFQLTSSPDNDNPIYPNFIMPLVQKICSIREESCSPIVIHCSCGVNRTGTLILCDLALNMLKKEESVDFYNLLLNLRRQRPNMIKTQKQYILAHLTVLECLMEQENVFKKSIQDNLNKKVLTQQLHHLKRLKWHDEIICSIKKHEQTLNYMVSSSSVKVDGYKWPGRYWVTRVPLGAENLKSFWNFVITEHLKVLVFLQKGKEEVWAFQNFQYQSNSTISIEVQNSVKNAYGDITSLKVCVYLDKTTKTIERKVQCVNVKSKNILKYERSNDMINILEELSCIPKFENERPILIACNDGITVSGPFVILSYILDKYKEEIEIDVCNALRIVRKSGAPFIKDVDQLEFIYRIVAEYLLKFDRYSHII